jgi:hypothetical protein
MGIVTDIKQELRKASALHINYSSRKRDWAFLFKISWKEDQ